MIKICDNCTECGVCEKICPKQAIEMKEDESGFLIPKINNSKCIECGLCQKRCPQNINIKIDDYYGKSYAAQCLNKDILLDSSSGGFFSVLATEIINQKGIVFGATMDENLNVYHRFVNNEKDLSLLRGSKYVFSNLRDTYKEAKEYLEKDILVLFSGLPCQIAGLKSYLNKKYDNLITVDVICHGTPSYKLFEVYKNYLEIKNNSKVKEYKFRNKAKHGWGVYWSYCCNNKNEKNGGLYDDPYIATFIKGDANKDACYKCKYVGFENRPADITLGDYWGIDIVHPEMASNDGVSAVIVNSFKAKEIVEKVIKKCKYVESEREKIARYNESLIRSLNRTKKREHIYDGLKELSPRDFIKRNLEVSHKEFLKTKIRLMIPYKIRIKIKKLVTEVKNEN